MNNLFNVENKVILITGSGKGLGFAIAKGLGLAGAKIILNGRNYETLEIAKKQLVDLGIRTYICCFDVTKSEQVEKQIAACAADVGEIDVLINNAGVQIRASLEEFQENDWNTMINTHLTGAFLVSKAVVKSMIKRNYGKIINICSVMSEIGRNTIAPYTAAKGGLKNLTKGMAIDWAKYNIQVNGIGPGYFLTDMTKTLADDVDFDNWLKKRTPAGRWGNPDELVGAAIFLSSEASSFINGQIIYIDGGMTVSV